MYARLLTAGIVAANGLLFAGCFVAHERGGGGGGGSPDDGGRRVDADIGPVDANIGRSVDSGHGGVDSGWHPPPFDAGPPGDRAGDVWEGYVKSYMLPSGSDHVRIVFDSASGDGARTGIVVFGEGPPPPPPTDPNVGYPPGVGDEWTDLPYVWEGFEYPIVEASVIGDRVRVTVNTRDLYARWCALQMPVSWGDGVYGCLPNTGGGYDPSGCYYNDPSSGAPIEVDCGKQFLCSRRMVCSCTAERCASTALDPITFDFHVVGDHGDGSVTLHMLHNVHLDRTR